ncbi:uncharacterized protein [Tenebrio molitor]|uniref:uncharacterized protein n=1 Tax=Tenebrio molitor TaxID=7067 RepID=UPI003624A1C0
MADKKSWTKEETYSLISHWELHPELWDVKNKNHKNRLKRQNALKALSTMFITTPTEINRKLHNMRTQFHQELRKMQTKHSGCGSDEAYQSSWEFFRAMSFICCDNSNPKTVDVLENASEIKESFDTIDIDESPLVLQDKKPERKKKLYETKQDDFVKKPIKMDPPADEFQVFGDFVACELRNIRSRKNQNHLKRMIQRAILQISELDDNEREKAYSTSTSDAK